ncbi:IS110 family transposase [Spirosoma areae]
MEKQTAALPVVNTLAAGIDIGSPEHWVAVDQNKENVRSFGIYTLDHQQLIDHLREHGITSVAMESTGTYWQTLFNALQKAGFTVLLVGGSQTKNVQAGPPSRAQNRLDRLFVASEASLTGAIVG